MEKRLYLPEEIINHIITSSGLDLKSIINCMVVSKQWRNLVSDLISNNPHLEAKGQFLVYDSRQLRFGALDDETNHIAWMRGEPHLKTVERFLSSCNGLVCFISHGSYDIYICNPLTGEYISIPCPRRNGHVVHLHQFNLGFCSSSNEYKLTYWTWWTIEVYTLGRPARWRSFPFDHHANLTPWRAAICVNGVVHGFLSNDRSILTFDLATEVLGSIPLPHVEDDKEIYQLECMDHCLVLTAGNPQLGLEIWARKEDESSGEFVWIKNWVINATLLLIRIRTNLIMRLVPQKLSTDGRIIMRDYADDLYSYDSRDKRARHLWGCKYDIKLHSYYTPTLVSPKKLMQERND